MTTVSMLLGDVTSGYPVKNSLRFRSSASAYLSRTFSNSSTNNLKGTLSIWTKRGTLGSQVDLISCYNGTSSASTDLYFNSSNQLEFDFGNTAANSLITNAVYRDPSAWYHIVISVDTTQATAANRVLMYVNGVQVTSFSTANYPAQNTVFQIVSVNANNRIGTNWNNTGVYYDGYMAEFNFIDGQALTASSFGTYDTNGVWQPINYSGSYGTNGFHLTFGNTTSTTTLGYDTSGNGNNWTTNNISLTAGSTYDSMTDSPTVTSASVANYAVLNPLVASTGTISDGNLGLSTSTTNATSSTFYPSTGKWYWENISTSGTQANTRFGIVNRNGAGADLGGSANGWAYLGDGRVYNNGSTSSYGVTYTTNDILMIALDLDAGKVWYGKNGTWMASGSPSTGANPSQTFTANQQMSPALASGTGTIVYAFNAGQRPFSYTPPTGFLALNTYNLPTPTIANGAQYMAATLYTGNGTSIALSNGANNNISTTFQPDLIWTKPRSATGFNIVQDSVRGAGYRLITDGTYVELYDATYGTFASNGFNIGSNANINVNGTTYVGWQWKASGSTASNTNGSITSTVSANTTAGFSVVTYTGTGANATVGHGLGVAPAMYIVKNRGQTGDWCVYHQNMNATPQNYYMQLNLTSAAGANSTIWNNTAPTSSVFSIGSYLYGNGVNYVAYCWAAVAGYSAFGSYTGNGSTDGPFVYTGFRPRYVLIKGSSGVSSWYVSDTSRDPSNVVNNELYPNLSNAESGSSILDILSNGFKIRTTSTDLNTNGNTQIYAVFAENPFNSSRAR